MTISREKLFAAVATGVLLLAGLGYVFLGLSDERQVRRVVGLGRDLLVRGEQAEFMDLISATYSFEGLGRDDLARMLRRVLPEILPFRAIIYRDTVKVSGPRAVALVSVLTVPGKGSNLPGTERSHWRIEFRKEAGKWKVAAIQPLAEGGTPAQSLDEIYRHHF